MCDTCGCVSPSSKVVDVNQSLLAANEAVAEKNRKHIESLGAVAINMISSPGSGKTTLLEKTIERISGEFRIGVIEGDIETERDADRIRAKGVPVVQLTTGGACHLDAALTHKGLHALENQLGDGKLDLLFIENVGNLVCPATFNLGEHHRLVMISVPEGPDKPAKYPRAFIGSQLFIISKTDLLPYFDFSVDEASKEALQLNPELTVLSLSSTTEDGFDQWLDYLRSLCR
ncbi:MAG: hydrogenase nickel incorporation protein HypB [Desulfobulbaceae bacterium]|nr:hydrogenase nickel incorporation protein HypB [Desulfobulbaceae bacterium]